MLGATQEHTSTLEALVALPARLSDIVRYAPKERKRVVRSCNPAPRAFSQTAIYSRQGSITTHRHINRLGFVPGNNHAPRQCMEEEIEAEKGRCGILINTK